MLWKRIFTDGAELLPTKLENLESTLLSSYKCYDKALSLEVMDVDRRNLLKRIGNIHNELGVLYMNQAGCTYNSHVILIKNSKYIIH